MEKNSDHCEYCVYVNRDDADNCECLDKLCIMADMGTGRSDEKPCYSCDNSVIQERVANRNEWKSWRGEAITELGGRMIDRYWADR